MSDILDLLNSETGKQIISGVSSETNQPEDKTASALSIGLPILLGAMKRNASSPEGANNLLGALTNDKHDGSILNNLSEFFGGGVNEDVKMDGLGILGHILGGSQDNVVGAVSKKTGLDVGSVIKILTVAAPIVLGMLGKEKRKKNVQSQSGLEDLLGGMLGGGRTTQHKQQSLIESLLDGNKDGRVVDDIAGMVLEQNKKGSIGGMLGGLFGK